MKITLELMEKSYREWNKEYFNDELVLPQFEIVTTPKWFGYFSCNKFKGNRRLKKQRISISDFYEMDEKFFKTIMLHEMIHYYLTFKHIDNQITHGEAFQKMAKEISEKTGLEIKNGYYSTNMKRNKDKVSKLRFFFAQYVGC